MSVNKYTSGADIMYFESNYAVCVRAVLPKECGGTKSDTLLGRGCYTQPVGFGSPAYLQACLAGP